ncbi:hypothetical protein CN680_30170, partial [Bacillus pseudomycoides]
LNDQIANIWASVAIVAGIAGLLASGAFVYVTYLNRQAQKKVEQGEEQISLAQEKIDQAESKIQQANT